MGQTAEVYMSAPARVWSPAVSFGQGGSRRTTGATDAIGFVASAPTAICQARCRQRLFRRIGDCPADDIRMTASKIPAYPGRAMKAELDALERAFEKAEHPIAAIVGGAKVSTKLNLLGHLLAKVETLMIGGGMANTFLAAQGKAIGKSLYEPDLLQTARDILPKAKSLHREVVLPVDAVVAQKLAAHAPSRVVSVDEVGAADMILDIGPRTIEHVISVLARSKTLVWNGPFGAFEFEPFDNGTIEVAEAAAELTTAGKLVSFAGGDTRWRRSTRLRSSAGSATSRLPEAPSLNPWRARRCPASKCYYCPSLGARLANRTGQREAAGPPAPNFSRRVL
jgi:Phosphoglycerate kinase